MWQDARIRCAVTIHWHPCQTCAVVNSRSVYLCHIFVHTAAFRVAAQRPGSGAHLLKREHFICFNSPLCQLAHRADFDAFNQGKPLDPARLGASPTGFHLSTFVDNCP